MPDWVGNSTVSFSSSPRDGGTRFKEIDYSSGHWEIIDLDISTSDESSILDFCAHENGKPYDWLGAIFRLPIWKGRWYCSEICVEALKRGGLKIKQSSFWSTPNSLYRELSH
jgi:uncharacterized protein YycO